MKSSSVDEENLPGNPFGGGFGSQAEGTRSEDRNWRVPNAQQNARKKTAVSKEVATMIS